MSKFLIIIAVLIGLISLVIIAVILLTPWMDRWGATNQEISAVYPGDELLPEPASLLNRAVTIAAAPEQIYPWLVQIGADKGGWYSYTWLEALARCPNTNADRIHQEWQNLAVGDEVKMCPGNSGPPPYIVAQLYPDQAMIIGHQDNGEWVDLYQFVIVPQEDGTSRLILRTRTMMVGGIWNVVHPIAFTMEQRMLRTIKERVETLSAGD